MISGAKIFKLLLLSCGLLLAGCFFDKTPESKVHELKGDVFGAYYIIKYRGDHPPEKFATELEIFFQGFNQEFSTYQDFSVISHFNKTKVNSPMRVSPRFIEMLELAHKLYQDSLGAFDPTLGPVIKLWGFGGGDTRVTPSEKDLKSAREKVGFDFIKWDKQNSTIWKTKEGLQLDINAFAPGWVCDLLGKRLENHGVQNYMVDMSGEILFKGTKSKDSPWVAGIEKPSLKYAEGIQTAFKIQDQAIATSGNYRNFYNENGQRKSHIIDPRTGRPVTHQISSASVISKTGLEADAWSTIMMVLGADGFALAEKNGMKVLLLKAEKPNLFDEVLSPSMSRFLKDQKL